MFRLVNVNIYYIEMVKNKSFRFMFEKIGDFFSMIYNNFSFFFTIILCVNFQNIFIILIEFSFIPNPLYCVHNFNSLKAYVIFNAVRPFPPSLQ